MFGWFKRKKEITPADIRLEQVKNLLFPPLALEEELGKEGDVYKFHIDYSVDTNLESALMDLQEGHNDEVTQSTINEAIKTLIKARKMLEAFPSLHPDARYIIVDNKSEDPSNIEA